MRTHSGEKPFTCDQCNYSSAEAKSLKSHKLKHTGEKPISCKQYRFSYSHSNGLKYHMLSHTGEKPFICKQCNYLFVYLHIRHPGTSFLRSSYNYIFKNIAYVIVYVWPSRTWDEILLPFQKGLFFPLGDIRLFLPTRIRICAYAHHPTWIRHGRIRMAIPITNGPLTKSGVL